MLAAQGLLSTQARKKKLNGRASRPAIQVFPVACTAGGGWCCQRPHPHLTHTPHDIPDSRRRRDDGGRGVVAEPDGLVALQALGPELLQRVELSLSNGQWRRNTVRIATIYCRHRRCSVDCFLSLIFHNSQFWSRAPSTQRPYPVQNAKEVVRPLGPRGQSGIGAHKRVVAKRGFVNVVEGADLLIGRVFPAEGRRNGQECSPQVRTFVGDCIFFSFLLSAEPERRCHFWSGRR